LNKKTEKGRDQNAKNTERSLKAMEFGVRKIKAKGKEVRGESCEVGKLIGTGIGK